MTSPYTYTFDDIRNRPVAVIGAGTLGRRIALMFASRGGTVRIYARRDEQLVAAKHYVADTLSRVIENRGFGEPGIVIDQHLLPRHWTARGWRWSPLPKSSRSRFRCGARSTSQPRPTPFSRPTRRRTPRV